MSAVQQVFSPLAIEHALMMVIVLYLLLSNSRGRLWWVALFILGGAALSLFTPTHSFQPAWDEMLMLVLPFLIWEAAKQVARGRGRSSLLGFIGIGFIITLLTLAMFVVGKLPISNSLLLATLGASLVWRLRAGDQRASMISGLGLLALAILLVEVDILAHGSRDLIRAVLAGLALGFPMGLIYFAVLRALKRRSLYGAGIYAILLLSFVIGEQIGISGVFMMFSAAVYIALYGYSSGIWRTSEEIPRFFSSDVSMVLAGIGWLALGWEAHVDFRVALLWPLLAGSVALLIGILIVRYFLPADDEQPDPYSWSRLLTMQAHYLLLMMGMLFLWPADLVLNEAQVELTILVSVLLLIAVRVLLPVIMEMTNVSLVWPDDTDD